jgi:hypothetical protein
MVEGRPLDKDANMRTSIILKDARGAVIAPLLIVSLVITSQRLNADDTATSAPAATSSPTDAPPGKTPPAQRKLPEPKGATRLFKDSPIWIDRQEKSVIAEGQIALREGMLEMFACTRNTKEHESIVSVNVKAYQVHTGLVALGAEPGHPVRYQPKFMPPAGTEIDIFVRYLDEKGKLQTARAQDWIKDNHTGKPMTYPFVFAGSSFYVDPDTNKQYYQGEHGDFVCVSNFGTAVFDIPVKSSKSNEELEFEAITKKIPPLGSPVYLVFKPKLKERGVGSGERGVKKATENTPKESAKNATDKAK